MNSTKCLPLALGLILLACSVAISQEHVPASGASVPSLHEFWLKAAKDVCQIQGSTPNVLKQCEAELANFHLASYEGRSDLAHLLEKSLTALLQMNPSLDRSRLIRAWRDIAISHVFRNRTEVFSKEVINNDTCWAMLLEEEKRDLGKPLTIGALRQSVRSFEDAYAKDSVYPLGKLVKLLNGLAEGSNLLLVKDANGELTADQQADALRLLNFRVTLEQVAFAILQGSQEGTRNVSTEPYPDEAVLIAVLASTLSDHTATNLTRLHTQILEEAFALRDYSSSTRGIKLAKALEPVVRNADSRTRAYLHVRIRLTERWCHTVQSHFNVAAMLDLVAPTEFKEELLPADRVSAMTAQSLIRAQLQFANRDFQEGLKTLAAAIPGCREAGDPQLLDLLAMQAQAHSYMKSFGASHSSLDQAKQAFVILAPSDRTIDRCHRAGVLLAELIVLLNEDRPQDARSILQPALHTAFSTNYESGVHFAAAKCLIRCEAMPTNVCFHLEQADELMQGSTQAEHMEVLLELVKVLNNLGKNKAAINKIVEYMKLRDKVLKMTRDSPAYWAHLFNVDFSDTDAEAVDLLMEAYLANPTPETLQVLLWSNEVCRSRGVQDGIMTSWMGNSMTLDATISLELSPLLGRMFPPIPGPDETVAHVKKTIKVLNELTKRQNTFLVYIHSVRLNTVVLVRCDSQQVAARALQGNLSEIEASLDKMVLQQQTVLGEYQKLASSPNSLPLLELVKRREAEQRIHSEELADMLLPAWITETINAAAEEPGLTVVVGGPLKKVMFLPLRIERNGERRYLRDAVASFSMAPSAHCVYLLMYYAIAQASSEEGTKSEPRLRTLLLASAPDEKLPFEKVDREGVARSFRGRVVISGTKQELLSRFDNCDDLHIYCHGVFVPGKPLDSGILLAGDVIRFADLRLRRMGSGGCATLAVCSAAEDQAVNGVDGWSFATFFFHAKCSAVIAPLWGLDQHYAARFFPELHKTMAGGTDSARALVLTMRAMGSKPDDPFKGQGLLGSDSPCFWSTLVHFGW
ncbi:CHAT domain-containing protein [Planctomicrobium piriforme]|uniref:CHAT domain-containing protein n=1 Tax=Planctomicrobium piriforme TaxID=1576369 RepID=A0A1I3TI81_9PLAN|nr:CHAT domain-containing protein [Planctomicrobium piriforme]SFJ70888.1 CHAT domain-containing protein [Planctomicrobium piriforme]